MTTPELLPCPFCGEMPELEQEFDYVSIGCGNQNCKMDNVDVFCQDQPNDLITAIAAWNTRAAQRWIPVTERLPEVGVLVLVYSAEHWTKSTLAVLKDDGISWRESKTDLMLYPREVTHWMPLPLPPKEVEG